LKPRYLGIAGALIAFISYALQWWTMTVKFTIAGAGTEVSMYLNQISASFPATMSFWYAWTALVLIIVGGALGVFGSLIQNTRLVLLVGGIFTLLAVVIFPVGLQNQLSTTAPIQGGPIVGVFSSGTYLGADYTTYLSYGFWLALVAAILMFVACRKGPVPIASQTSPTTQQPQPTSQPPT
jgi:hypothetical protein